MSFLTKYKRQPKLYIDLPSSGKHYDDTVIENEQYVQLPVFAMSAMDEISTKTPDALFSGQAVADVLKSCIPAIKDPWKLLKIDVDYMLAAVKIASYGDKIELQNRCTHCNNEQTIDFDLNNLIDYFDQAVIEKEFEVETLKFSLLPINYKIVTKFGLELYNIQKQLLNAATIEDTEQREKIQQELLSVYNKATVDVLMPYINSITELHSNEQETNIETISQFLQSNDRDLLDIVVKNINDFITQTSFPEQEIQCGNTECGKTYKMKYNGDYSSFFEKAYFRSRNLNS